MVWGLFPVDTLSGEEKYYIFCKGTYKVGRKGCDVIINKDKGVSRIHAEIVVDEMVYLDPFRNKVSSVSTKVRVRDCSKYGTFINKNLGSKEKVHEFPNKETTLKDGDMISFGTGNATYRFCFVPLNFFSYYSGQFQGNQLLRDKITSIGACISCSWTPECTHVLADESMPLTEDVIDAIVAKKPFVVNSWVEIVAEKCICTELPSCSSYSPTLVLEGVSVKVADPRSRDNCLRGYTFLLESTQKYKFKDKMCLLLEVAGAKVVSISGISSTSQALEDEENCNVVCVIPAELQDQVGSFRNLSALSRVNEMSLIYAALSGRLDPSIIVSAPVVVSSSCSTDETVVADSDPEIETATSVQSATIRVVEASQHYSKEVSIDHVAAKPEPGQFTCFRDGIGSITAGRNQIDETETATSVHSATIRTVEASQYHSKQIPINHLAAKSETGQFTCSRDGIDGMTARRNQIDESESGTPDIIYSQNLIVRDKNTLNLIYSSTNSKFPNFKRFRKKEVQSGNSFSNLIPFSKYPYKGSDYGSEEVLESVKEEKKRKQMEAVAEDLFNNEKGKRRGVAGALRGLLAPS